MLTLLDSEVSILDCGSKKEMQCVQFQNLSRSALLRKSILTIDELYSLLGKKCVHGILENIQDSGQVLLVNSLTTMDFYHPLHLEARFPL